MSVLSIQDWRSFDFQEDAEIVGQDFEQMNFDSSKFVFKKSARNLPEIGPLHYMILKLENSEEFEVRTNLITNIKNMIRSPKPMA